MIDLHNHILPGVDDGAADLAESVQIARQFLSEGVTQIVATSHLNPEQEGSLEAPAIRDKVEQVRAVLSEEGLQLAVLPGQEVYLTPDVPALLERGTALTLGNSKAVLVEVSMLSQGTPLFLEDALFRLQLAGYQPVLAHPERYPFVQRSPERVMPLVDRGVVLQLTAPSLLGEYGGPVRRTAENLLQRAAYTLASSDRHHPGPNRSLASLHAELTRRAGSDLADLLLVENPRRLLGNQVLRRPEPLIPERSGLFGRLFSR